MEFSIPLTIENRRDVELSIRIKNVWFSEGRPEINKKGGWKLPGQSLEPVRLRVEDAAGNVSNPITIRPHGIAHMRIFGTATSPVCHAGPFVRWRFVFIDWITSPIEVDSLVQEVPMRGGGRSVDPELTPTFPLPSHYPSMQVNRTGIDFSRFERI